jgi:hypothetical protein
LPPNPALAGYHRFEARETIFYSSFEVEKLVLLRLAAKKKCLFQFLPSISIICKRAIFIVDLM